jgi:hypothetical protein
MKSSSHTSKKKTPKRRDPYAQEILDRKGPYRPKVIHTKPKHPSVADEFDDWYFTDDRGQDA